ncbi:MAG: DUF6378 domain-containing protein [Clostridiaceae bacterium]|nr:DUF6378 domain-containing protein [Clostridiaceae bacterium]
MKRSEVLNAALKCVCEDRDKQYGSPSENFARIAALWSDYRDEAFTPKDVAIMMVLVKVSRSAARDSIDNFVDIAGYAACGGEVLEKKDVKQRHETGKTCEHGKQGKFQVDKASAIYKVPCMHGKHIIWNGKEHAPREKFYFCNGDMWIGVDNSTGELWVEDFITEKGCIAWLEGDFAAGDYEEEMAE